MDHLSHTGKCRFISSRSLWAHHIHSHALFIEYGQSWYMLLLSFLFLKSEMRLTSILVVDLCFPSSSPLILSHCCLHHPSPLPLFLALILPSHFHQISLHAVLPFQSWSSSSPTLHPQHIFINCSLPFFLRVQLPPEAPSHLPPPSAPPFFTCLFCSFPQFFSPNKITQLTK